MFAREYRFISGKTRSLIFPIFPLRHPELIVQRQEDQVANHFRRGALDRFSPDCRSPNMRHYP